MWRSLALPDAVDWVALGTALLALATFWMGWFVKNQARETRRLAEIAGRQLSLATTPVVRVVRSGQPDQADMFTVNEGGPDEALLLHLEVRGPAAAEVERCTLSIGGVGRIHDPDRMMTPSIEPDSDRGFDFHPSEDDKRLMARGLEVVLQVVYLAVASGLRYRMRTVLKRVDDPDERWLVLREEQPKPVGEQV